MKHLLFLILLVGLTGLVRAQSQDTTGMPRNEAADTVARKTLKSYYKRSKFLRDTVRRERRKFDSTLFTNINVPTSGDYAEDLERVYQLLNRVPVVTESFVRLDDIDDQLDQEDSALAILKDRLSQSDRSLNIRNLQMFNTLLDALDKNIKGYARHLNTYDDALDSVRKQIDLLKKDTLMLHIFRDTALKNTFQPQLQQLKVKWRQVDSLISLNGGEINALKSQISAHTITISELLYRVDAALKSVGNKAFGKERRYLWEPRSSTANRYTRENFQRSVDSERQLARFYFSNTRSKRLWLLLTGLIFFFWVWLNFRSLRRMDRLKAIEHFHFTYLHPRPFGAALIFILSLAPLFDLHAPAIYIESVTFLTMIVLTFIFRTRLSRILFLGWCGFLVLFLLLPAIRILGLPLSLQRWANLIIDSGSVAFACYFLFRKGKFTGQPRLVWWAAGLYLLFNLLSVVCNLFGRVTLSQIFAATAVYSFAQTVSLAVFVRVIIESFLLQIQGSRIRKSYPENFDFAGIIRSITRFAILLAIVLWLIVFATNLNLFDALNDLLVEVLTSPREVGNFTFTFGGIVLFLGIIWIANFLQKYIAYFFGDMGDDASLDDKGQRSRLLVTRLILLVGGFLLAVAASGMPVDRITVILGALGVGVGLGLQSIVNNFVSGIILIFDRPVRIGDTVEVGDKKGRVREIGIRSSTLLTDDGAEVIIPNGDMLSNHIVNWTLSNNHVRVALTFPIDKPAALADVDPDGIRALVQKNKNVLEQRDPEVIVNTLSSKKSELRVYFWIKDITRTPYTTNEVRTAIYQHLDHKGISVQ